MSNYKNKPNSERINPTFWHLDNPVCIICFSRDQLKLGQRGNREYIGADQSIEPHIYTNIVKCNKCGFVFCNPTIKGIERLEHDHYNNPDVYSAYLQGDISTVYKTGKKIVSYFKPSGRLLDIGAGKGDFVFMAINNGYDAKGIEPSHRFCDYAHHQYGINLQQGYLDDGVNLRGQLFDIITLFHVLEHVQRPHEFLATISEYLKADGIVYIEVPNADASLLKLADLLFRIIGKSWSSRLSPLHAPFHSLGYSQKSLRYLLEHNGFNIVYSATSSGIGRGYDTSGRFPRFLTLAWSLVIHIFDYFSNRELISIVAKKCHSFPDHTSPARKE